MTLLAESRRRIVVDGPNRALRFLPRTALVLDLVVITSSLGVAMLARDRLELFQPSPETVGETLGVVGPLIIVAWLLAIALGGGYQKDVFGAGTDEYKRILLSALATAGMMTANPRFNHEARERCATISSLGWDSPLTMCCWCRPHHR